MRAYDPARTGTHSPSAVRYDSPLLAERYTALHLRLFLDKFLQVRYNMMPNLVDMYLTSFLTANAVQYVVIRNRKSILMLQLRNRALRTAITLTDAEAGDTKIYYCLSYS